MNPGSSPEYALGSTDAEHERLIRQAKWLAPHTERLFRDAGIGPGQRVLDLGSGVGDVSLLAARFVGPAGEVLGVERDSRTIARAKSRVAESGFRNVRFTQTDVSQISSEALFDAVAGRYILMYLPDPVGVLRSLLALVRPGGVFAFQEPDWISFLHESSRLPLWSIGASLLVQVCERTGTNTSMGLDLPRAFQDAGLPAPSVRTDTLLGAEEWMPECLQSMRPQIAKLGLSAEPLGDFDTLSERLHGEVAAQNVKTPLPALVSAWARVPANRSSRP
jgi:SAM-dependent methyltransferase